MGRLQMSWRCSSRKGYIQIWTHILNTKLHYYDPICCESVSSTCTQKWVCLRVWVEACVWAYVIVTISFRSIGCFVHDYTHPHFRPSHTHTHNFTLTYISCLPINLVIIPIRPAVPCSINMMASKFAYVSKLLKVVKEKFRRPNLFNDKLCFPPITDCPTEYSSDPDWFWALADKNYRNKRHWCLIAEITGVEMHHYVHLQLRDRDGNDTFVKLIPSPDPKKDREIFLLGHTVAILYAERYGFNDSSVGVRVEDRGNIMVSLTPNPVVV